MVPKDDWRRNGQEEYLTGAELIFVPEYKPHSAEWEHEHCEFCWDKIGTGEEDLKCGYCTPDRRHWICKTCFEDFRDEFNWKISDTEGIDG